MITVAAIVILLVHLNLEYRVWIRKEVDIFRKYRKVNVDPMLAARNAYLSKAVWLVLMIGLQTLGRGFEESFVVSFLVYAVLVILLLSRNFYTLAQLGLALFCFVWFFARSLQAGS
jgi:hypothetical protein